MNCPPEKKFWCQDGRELKNLDELANALLSMHEATYRHHVYSGHNDFANWTEHVFGEKELAKKMRESKTKQEMAKVVRGRFKKPSVKKTVKKAVKKKTPMKKIVKKKAAKKKAKRLIPDEKYHTTAEMTHPHIAMATNIALGIVVGGAVTILVLMLM